MPVDDPIPEDLVPVPARFARMRRYASDGALWLFDRETGLSAVCDGPETAHLRRRAPRVVQFGITNACNLRCGFCSRDLAARSEWTVDSAFAILSELGASGVLEVAFGGGEPFAFRRFDDLVCRLYDETELAVSVTTNGTLLRSETLARVGSKLGQVRVSAYDDSDWRGALARLEAADVRRGVNWLLTPARLRSLEDDLFELLELGVRDVLLLSYNGEERALHIPRSQWPEMASRVKTLARALDRRMQIKLDVCWGARMDGVPQLFAGERCVAGVDFIVLGSDRTVRPCSFHDTAVRVETADDVLRVWRTSRDLFEAPARRPGCARDANFGYERLGAARRRLEMVSA